MTFKQAKNKLQKHMDKRDSTFEDNGNEVTGWNYFVGERVTAMDSTSGGEQIPLDEGVFGFIVYLLPPDKTARDLPRMTEEEQDKYGTLWCVLADGEPYMP